MYAMFERICGVRGEVEKAIAPPRGLPKDLSVITKIVRDYDGTDGHSDTWLTGAELQDLVDWVEKNYDSMFQHERVGYLCGNTFRIGDGSVAKEIEDVRFICWFNN